MIPKYEVNWSYINKSTAWQRYDYVQSNAEGENETVYVFCDSPYTFMCLLNMFNRESNHRYKYYSVKPC